MARQEASRYYTRQRQSDIAQSKESRQGQPGSHRNGQSANLGDGPEEFSRPSSKRLTRRAQREVKKIGVLMWKAIGEAAAAERKPQWWSDVTVRGYPHRDGLGQLRTLEATPGS